MNVIAFSTPNRPDWRWRIVNYAGELVEESQASFPTIKRALSEGNRRMEDLNMVDRSTRPTYYARSTSYLRRR